MLRIVFCQFVTDDFTRGSYRWHQQASGLDRSARKLEQLWLVPHRDEEVVVGRSASERIQASTIVAK